MNKKEIIKKYGLNENDSGRTEVQIVILTNEILSLTNHINANKKDKHSKLGLYKKVSKRASLLSYLKSKDYERYKNILKATNLKLR